MNLVVGATGFLGGEICRRLGAAGKPVRAFVRPGADPARVEAVRATAAEVAEGDLQDPDSLAAACRGVEAVFSTATTIARPAGDIRRVDLEGQTALIDAAVAAGVRHFVFASVSGHVPDDNPLIQAKRAVEKHLTSSGLTYTILRPGVFMEVWLTPLLGFDYAAGNVTVYGAGRNPISYISLGDVAEFAVRSLDNPAAANATLELGGPEALSPHDVVHIFEEVAGRSFQVHHVPEEALRRQRAEAKDPFSESFAALMQHAAAGDAVDMTKMLRDFPIHLTSVRDYAQQALRSHPS
jgi:NADH dehydrogenase